jgi:hypothetical protein
VLGDQFRLSTLHAIATDDEAMKLIDEIDRDKADHDGAADIEPDLFRIQSRSEVSAVAEAISELVNGRAVHFAQRRADLDVLIRQFADPDEPEFVDIRVPALLAASGRFEEARTALDRWQPAPELLVDRQLRVAQKLRNWIDTRGDQAPAPTPSE